MLPKLTQLLSTKDHLDFVVVFVCAVALLLLPATWVQAPALLLEEPAITVAEQPLVTDAAPVSISIPKLSLAADFGPALGLKATGEVEVPTDFEQVGWYEPSPTPGDLGPAVVLGHVDSRSGPAVFFSIGQLDAGDQIIITNSDGREHIFVVEFSQRYEQTSFPTELVYGDIDHAGLRLITCSGWYDKASDRYSHNRVVFARLLN